MSHGVEAGLLGIEIGRSKVRLVLLDPDGKVVDDVVERPIAKGGGPRDPMEEESSTRAAIEAGAERLGLTPGMPIVVGVTIGFPHCGVGSGPALRDWLADLSVELGEPIVHVGDHGVSYAPAHCIDFVRRVFEPTGLLLDRIELAPVAASRVLESLRSGAVTLGSGVAWSARILDRDVLEAFEIVDGTFDEVLHVVSNGVGRPIEHLEGVFVDDDLCRSRGLAVGSLAPAVGVAVALHDGTRTNLLDGQHVSGSSRSGPLPRASGPLPTARESRPMPEARGARAVSGERRDVDQARAVSGERREPAQRWEANEDLLSQPPRVEPRPVEQWPRGSREGYEAGEFGYARDYPDDTTYKLRRPPESREPAPRDTGIRDPRPAEGAQRWAGGSNAPARGAGDDLAGIESFSPQPTSLESREGFHVSDFLLGALLMLAVVLVIALVVL